MRRITCSQKTCIIRVHLYDSAFSVKLKFIVIFADYIKLCFCSSRIICWITIDYAASKFLPFYSNGFRRFIYRKFKRFSYIAKTWRTVHHLYPVDCGVFRCYRIIYSLRKTRIYMYSLCFKYNFCISQNRHNAVCIISIRKLRTQSCTSDITWNNVTG